MIEFPNTSDWANQRHERDKNLNLMREHSAAFMEPLRIKCQQDADILGGLSVEDDPDGSSFLIRRNGITLRVAARQEGIRVMMTSPAAKDVQITDYEAMNQNGDLGYRCGERLIEYENMSEELITKVLDVKVED